MKHIIVTDLGDGYKRLTAQKGYRLYNTVDRKYYSEAVVKSIKGWTAVKA